MPATLRLGRACFSGAEQLQFHRRASIVVGRMVGSHEPPVAGLALEAVVTVGLEVVVPSAQTSQALEGGGVGEGPPVDMVDLQAPC